jgi:hypothetical protein
MEAPLVAQAAGVFDRAPEAPLERPLAKYMRGAGEFKGSRPHPFLQDPRYLSSHVKTGKGGRPGLLPVDLYPPRLKLGVVRISHHRFLGLAVIFYLRFDLFV